MMMKTPALYRIARLTQAFVGSLLVCTAPTAYKASAKETLAVAENTKGSRGPHQQFAEDLEHRTFDWFWTYSNPRNGLVPDRAPLPHGAASIASVGFGLTAYGIGAERGYISRDQAVERTLTTLRFLLHLPQGGAAQGMAGNRGFFYHFLDSETGLRVAPWSELSSVDTALLMGGVLFAQSYYDRSTQKESEIRSLAETLYRRVDWRWMKGQGPWLSMGWTPEGGFLPAQWKGYNEGLFVYVLALGAPEHGLDPALWERWTATYDQQWGEFQGRIFLNFAPLFGHQYGESWLDLRDVKDSFNRQHQKDYFQNSRDAVFAQQSYALQNPGGWQDYGANIWGLTASDGPGSADQSYKGQVRHYLAYSARGAGKDYVLDDGTIAPTAAGGSVAFAPEIALPALEEMKERYGERLYGRYGFADAFNPSFKTKDGIWIDEQQLGIDQGPIVLMLENWRTGLVWRTMKKNPFIQQGLRQAGFRGGWLDQVR